MRKSARTICEMLYNRYRTTVWYQLYLWWLPKNCQHLYNISSWHPVLCLTGAVAVVECCGVCENSLVIARDVRTSWWRQMHLYSIRKITVQHQLIAWHLPCTIYLVDVSFFFLLSSHFFWIIFWFSHNHIFRLSYLLNVNVFLYLLFYRSSTPTVDRKQTK